MTVILNYKNKAELLAALEGRREYCKQKDKEILDKHRRQEMKAIADFRAVCTAGSRVRSVKDLDKFIKDHNLDARYGRIVPPTISCPRSLESALDRLIAQLGPVKDRKFVIRETGSWAAYYKMIVPDTPVEAVC